MKNRLRTTTSQYPDFFAYTALSRMNLFEGKGSLTQKSIVDAHIEERLNQARMEGYRQAKEEIKGTIKKVTKEVTEIKEKINKLKTEIRKEIDNYINLVTRISDFIKEKTGEISNNKISIVETRTDFYLGTKKIEILFVINADPTNELNFSNFLVAVENAVFKEEKYLSELLYINKKNNEIDKISLSCDYPLIRTRK